MLNKVENIVAKGEIAHHEQFLLWQQCFQKFSAAISSKCVYRWERVKALISPLKVTQHSINLQQKVLKSSWQKYGISQKKKSLTLSLMQTRSDSSTAADFWKHFYKKEKLLKTSNFFMDILFTFSLKCFQIHVCCMKERDTYWIGNHRLLINPFRHTTNLQQTTYNGQKLNISINLCNWTSWKNCGKSKEFAHLYEQILLLQQCFKKSCAVEVSKSACRMGTLY